MLIKVGWHKDFINKMDCEFANKQARYDETANEIKNMLIKAGWQKDVFDEMDCELASTSRLVMMRPPTRSKRF